MQKEIFYINVYFLWLIVYVMCEILLLIYFKCENSFNLFDIES